MREERLAEIFKALGHPTRVKIVEYLADGEKCVKDIWQEIGVPQPTVSQHINILKNAGIISFRKDGVKTCYRVEMPVVIEILKLLEKEVGNGAGD
ncbi:ArsR/SmtB family transcription factor [Thermovibrio ammonificans]|uniref:Transcriptional regulator, ArsR family n=1 Tax=Thermovibrio ammonificans (strain DSM 15698 / JCM 12110 / HB-1) TaxID=648996 RepID=E8T4H9_THEA1|nr:metalloregulator ArsR/SmtB family transcription factor [Thermovibrio ammonificans]ADU97437.1 transcriptional regulator, ArsR family [Thermovibrio ammonificans HB-1]